MHKDYCRALHEVDRHAGTACDAPLTGGGKCSYTKPWTDDKHSVGGAQRELGEKFGEVQPLVFGHFGELNGRFVELLHRIAESMAFQHHRAHGWKNAKAGICRAKVGVIRRVSMVVLRETARHVVRGLAPWARRACWRTSPPGRRRRRLRRTWMSSARASARTAASRTTSATRGEGC